MLEVLEEGKALDGLDLHLEILRRSLLFLRLRGLQVLKDLVLALELSCSLSWQGVPAVARNCCSIKPLHDTQLQDRNGELDVGTCWMYWKREGAGRSRSFFRELEKRACWMCWRTKGRWTVSIFLSRRSLFFLAAAGVEHFSFLLLLLVGALPACTCFSAWPTETVSGPP